MDKEERKEKKEKETLTTINSKLSPLDRVIHFTWLVNSCPVSCSTAQFCIALFHIYLVSCEISNSDDDLMFLTRHTLS